MNRSIVSKVVAPDDGGIRPAGPPDACFYCGSSVGNAHSLNCVTVKARVRVRAVIEYEVDMPQGWAIRDRVFHRNGSSWCSDNGIDEIRSKWPEEHDGQCSCDSVVYHVLDEESGQWFGPSDDLIDCVPVELREVER